MMAFSGVRSSWDMLARNCDLCRLRLQLAALLLDLLEQPGVLDRQRRLAGERLEQRDDLRRERAGRPPRITSPPSTRSSRSSGTASSAR